jgi:NADPH2:quinone reductase
VRCVVCDNFGPPDDLRIEDVDRLEAGPGQVVVDVRAAGVNFVDALFVRGTYQIKPRTPFTPGSEIAGVVSGSGQGVSGFRAGERVIASCGLGGFAEQVAVPAGSVVRLPDGVDFERGASLMQSYATALFCLTHRTKLEPDEIVLVLGAGGGVGRACIDVARSLGARAIGVASSEEKREVALDAGAEAVIDPGAEDVKTRARELSGGAGVDLVVDPVGGDLAEPSLRALRVFGRYLVVGFAAGSIPRLPLNQILLNNRNVIGVDWGAWALRDPQGNAELVREVLAGAADGRFHPAAPATVPLEKAADVLRDLEERRIVGKVVLVP